MRKIFKAGFVISALCVFGPFLLAVEVATVKIIRSESDLPEKFCSLWKAGDLVVSDGRFLLLVGGSPRAQVTQMGYPAPDARGSILGFVPAGRTLQSTMNVGVPQIRIKNKTEYVAYESVTPGPGNPADGTVTLECAAVYEKSDGGKLEIKTSYRVFPGQGKVVLESIIKNAGTTVCKDLSYSLYFNADHTYSFSPYNRASTPRLNFRVYPRKGHYLSWLNSNPVESGEKKYPGKLAPGETFKVQYTLAVDIQPDRLLRILYETQNVKTLKTTFAFKHVENPFMEVIVKELYTSAIFFRTFLEEPFALDIPLPEGDYVVRANFFPAVRERNLAVKPDSGDRILMENPAFGTVRVMIKNGKDEYVPGKVSVIGLDPTRSPYFHPENPRDTGRSFEAEKNSLFPPQDGLDVNLPVGTYLIAASRGPEYTRDERVIEVLKGDVQSLAFTIDKVIDTPNLVSFDAHVHTQNSDGQVSLAERLKSIVGEGIDVAASADHNFITDDSPVLKKLGLNKILAVIPGSEVTKNGLIHYCTFPMVLHEEEEWKGAIRVDSNDVSVLFARSRAANPKAFLQVNHPRADNLGYFNNFELDKESAAAATKGFDTGFTLLEVMNGPGLLRGNPQVIEDWFHLLNRGYFYPIAGNSDSHAIDGDEPGFARTYVYYSGGKGDAFDAAAFFQALGKGRSFVTNGPIVDFKVNAASVPGETLTAKDGKVEVSIKVSSAPWISVDEVRLIVNGERRFILPVKTDEKSLEKFRKSFSVGLDRDAALVVEVMGKRTIYPVVQRPAADGLPVNAVLPYALTNPIFIDVDGNGKFDPPWPEKVKIRDKKEDEKQP